MNAAWRNAEDAGGVGMQMAGLPDTPRSDGSKAGELQHQRGVMPASPWIAFTDGKTGHVIYQNTITEETTWEEPAEGYTWVDSFPDRSMPVSDPEHLGANYLDSDWLGPSAESADSAARNAVSKRARGSLCLHVDDIDDIGVGCTLFLHYEKFLAGLFWVLSLFTIIPILASMMGSRLPPDVSDWAALTSLGNVGDSRLECDTSGHHCGEEIARLGAQYSTALRAEGHSSIELASYFAILDTLSCCIFLGMSLLFYFEAAAFSRRYRASHVRISDYAVQVWGLLRMRCSQKL